MVTHVVLWLATAAQAQDTPPVLRPEWFTWKPSDAPAPSFDSTRSQVWMERVGFEASGLSWDPRAEILYGMAEKATRAVFGVDSLRLRARSADAKKGTIAVHWEFVSGSTHGDIYLEDKPVGAYFGVRVQDLTVSEMTDAAPILFRARPRMQIGDDGSAQFAWGVSMAQFDMMNYRAVATRNAQSGDWFMTVFQSRLRLADYYRGVTEQHRIPAFSEMLKAWPLERMVAEVGAAGPDAGRRDQTILDEIASRNLPLGVWREILGRGPQYRDLLQDRCHAILSALRLADPSLARVSQFVEAALDWVETLLPGADFRLLTGLPCTDRLQGIAFRSLEKNRSGRDAVNYIGYCAASPQALDRLSALSPPPHELQFQLRNAMESIRGRIAQQQR